jgi:hypothetical protein
MKMDHDLGAPSRPGPPWPWVADQGEKRCSGWQGGHRRNSPAPWRPGRRRPVAAPH